MSNIEKQKCLPCEEKVSPLKEKEVQLLLKQIKNWHISQNKKNISKVFKFENFKKALNFINKVGKIAEQEGHHPDIYLTNYKIVKIKLTTHFIKGLSQNDFILASKIDKLIK